MDTSALNLPAPLRDYQWQGVRFLMERDSALLADDMGLGKTVQVAVALSLAMRNPEINRALVVVPASLRLNWEREIHRWAPDLGCRRVYGTMDDRIACYRLPFHVLVASYDQVRSDVHIINRESNIDLVVLDEAQRIRNGSSGVAVACRTLSRKRSWALTGTPLENNVADLLSVFRFVRSGLLHSGLTRSELHERLAPWFLRRLKTDVFEQLPPILDQEIPMELGETQRLRYDQLWNNRRSVPEGQLLALLTRLKQVCNSDPETGESCKLDALRAVLDGFHGPHDKAIVFSQYVETLEWIQRELKKEKLRTDFFHGGLSDTHKDEVLRSFRNETGPRVLLMSLTAGATGLNLQEANMVVFFDRWWNPAVEEQALHRAYRFGRDRPLHVLRFCVVDTVEERIQEVLHEKKALFHEYIEGAESAEVDPLTGSDLRKVLGLD
jgi:SNF2 family DNA or RNA helicase